jgi:hypothetical protein
MTLLPAPVLARDPCQPDDMFPIPNCESQVQAPVTYTWWQSRQTSYYCKGDHPYFWGLAQDYFFAYTWDNSCFTVTENIFLDDFNMLSVLVTNWCLKTEDITVTLACSATPQPGTAFCPTTGGPVSDPGCPQQGASRTFCGKGPIPICTLMYKETCANQVSYQCQNTLGVAYCLRCASGQDAPRNASRIGTIPPLDPSGE